MLLQLPMCHVSYFPVHTIQNSQILAKFEKRSSALKRPLFYAMAFHFFEHYPLLVGVETLLDW